MSQLTLTDVDGSGKPATRLLGVYVDWTGLYLQVQGPATVRISNSMQDLGQPAPGGALQGLQLTQMATATPSPIWWRGELWAISSGPTAIEMIVIGPKP